MTSSKSIETVDQSVRMHRLGRFADSAKVFGSLKKADPATSHRSGDGELAEMFSAGDCSAAELKFVELAYEDGWVFADLDWPRWVEGERGGSLMGNGVLISESTEQELAMIVTVLIRQDRFVSGTLLGSLNNGSMLALANRADELCKGACR